MWREGGAAVLDGLWVDFHDSRLRVGNLVLGVLGCESANGEVERDVELVEHRVHDRVGAPGEAAEQGFGGYHDGGQGCGCLVVDVGASDGKELVAVWRTVVKLGHSWRLVTATSQFLSVLGIFMIVRRHGVHDGLWSKL